MKANKLELDIDELLPAETIQIGQNIVEIRPLSFWQYQKTIKKIKALYLLLVEQGVNLDNWKKPDNLLAIAEVLVDQFPELLEEVSGISQESLQSLPLELLMSIITKVLEVNLKSKDVLVKNFQALVDTITLLLPQGEDTAEKK